MTIALTLAQEIFEQGVVDELTSAFHAVAEHPGAASKRLKALLAIGTRQIVGLAEGRESELATACRAERAFGNVHREATRTAHRRDRRSTLGAGTQ